MGLTVTAVARLSGLSRATVSALENGSIKDLSLARSQNLLDVLGLSLSIPPAHKRPNFDLLARRPALDLAAQTSNVLLRSQITAADLQPAFLAEATPEALLPHIRVLLDEAPVSLLARIADQMNVEKGVDRKKVWSVMRDYASRLHVTRDIFAPEVTAPLKRVLSPAHTKQVLAGD